VPAGSAASPTTPPGLLDVQRPARGECLPRDAVAAGDGEGGASGEGHGHEAADQIEVHLSSPEPPPMPSAATAVMITAGQPNRVGFVGSC
jgi:hypothetical protein